MNILVVIVAILILAKVNSALNLKYSFGIPQQVKIQTNAINFIQPVTIYNPSKTRLTLYGVNLLFESDVGQQLGLATLKGTFIIEGQARTTIPVQVTTLVSTILKSYPMLRNGLANEKITVRYKGYVLGEGIKYTMNETTDLPLVLSF